VDTDRRQSAAARIIGRRRLDSAALIEGGVARQLQRSYTDLVAELRFEWDDRKNAENKRKHAVSFEEAQTVFYDDRAILIDDPDEVEDRFLLLGLSTTLRTLVVCHCYRVRDEVIRIISARKALREERADYETRWRR
jgi:hypothetical protein